MKTADLFDQHEKTVGVCSTQFNTYGGRSYCHGKMVTLKCFEDNSLIKKTLAENGKGQVLVVDGGASLRRALMGDLIAESAVKNEWEGIIIRGAIRDSEAILSLKFHVKALGTNPRKSTKLDLGIRNMPLEFGETVFIPGHYIYSDGDGILVSESPLL